MENIISSINKRYTDGNKIKEYAIKTILHTIIAVFIMYFRDIKTNELNEFIDNLKDLDLECVDCISINESDKEFIKVIFKSILSDRTLFEDKTTLTNKEVNKYINTVFTDFENINTVFKDFKNINATDIAKEFISHITPIKDEISEIEKDEITEIEKDEISEIEKDEISEIEKVKIYAYIYIYLANNIKCPTIYCPYNTTAKKALDTALAVTNGYAQRTAPRYQSAQSFADAYASVKAYPNALSDDHIMKCSKEKNEEDSCNYNNKHQGAYRYALKDCDKWEQENKEKHKNEVLKNLIYAYLCISNNYKNPAPVTT